MKARLPAIIIVFGENLEVRLPEDALKRIFAVSANAVIAARVISDMNKVPPAKNKFNIITSVY
jgi:hypothetical protein